MKHFGNGQQYIPMMEHVRDMVAIDNGGNGQPDADNNEVPCHKYCLTPQIHNLTQ